MKNIKINIEKRIGLRIRELRLSMGLSQIDLSKLSNINRSYIVSVEAGNRNISIKNIPNIKRTNIIS